MQIIELNTLSLQQQARLVEIAASTAESAVRRHALRLLDTCAVPPVEIDLELLRA